METEKNETVDSTKPHGTQLPSDDDNELHYYSGGEIKELANTKVGGFLTGFWMLLIVACVGSMAYFGGVRQFGLYRPQYGSTTGMQEVQADLTHKDLTQGTAVVNVLDLNQVDRPAGQTVQEAIDKGQDVYQMNCIGCHGPNEDGNGINAQTLNPKPRNLHDAPFMQGLSYQRITTSVHKGVPGTAMPRWENTLNDDQIKDVIVYVFSLTSPLPDSTPAAAASVPASFMHGGIDYGRIGVASFPSHKAGVTIDNCTLFASAS